MKVAELRQKSEPELKENLNTLLRRLFKFRIKLANFDEGVKPSDIKKTRRNIARVKTLLNEKLKQNIK